MASRKSILFLIVGIALGAAGVAGYFLLVPRPNPEQKVLISRYVLQIPVTACKQLMTIGFRTAGFQNVTPDPGDGVGIGAVGDKISGAALCMPALGVASVAMAGSDPAMVLARMQDFANAMAVTNFAPQNQPAPQRR